MFGGSQRVMQPSIQSNSEYFDTLNELCQLRVALYALTRPSATTNLYYVSVDLLIQDISYKWNHTMCTVCVWILAHSISPVSFVKISASRHIVAEP